MVGVVGVVGRLGVPPPGDPPPGDPPPAPGFCPCATEAANSAARASPEKRRLRRFAMGTPLTYIVSQEWEKRALCFVADLLAEVSLVAHFVDLVHLGFQPVHMLFFVLEQPFE